MIYLDNSATTKPCREAVEAMMLAMTENWGNPSALYNFGIDTARQLKTARNTVAAALGAEPDRIFFTSGGTEADNWAIFSTAKRYGKKNKHIITTAIEHHAILHCMKELEAQGFEVTYLQPDETGTVTVDATGALVPGRLLSRSCCLDSADTPPSLPPPSAPVHEPHRHQRLSPPPPSPPPLNSEPSSDSS